MPNNLIIKIDMQCVDMGVSITNFELTCRELKLSGKWQFAEPVLISKADEEYIIIWII